MLTSTRNITRTFRLTSDQDRSSGRAWYARAHALAEELDPENPVRGAAVIAVLSPMVQWERNQELARMAYQWHAQGLSRTEFWERWPFLRANGVKAYRILSGEPPEQVVSGPKVTSFWHTIANPDDLDTVVVDRHAFSVAAGRTVDDTTRQRFLERKGNYDVVADQYRRASKILSREMGERWSPAQIQAATWEHWRNQPSSVAA